ncbi:MFS transporter [Polycladomyces subterraneus]|uniref:MFS transporter n=1 Tax=Polycladomyces subterraneus TaxID=1016997 RepID=A0ABT8IQW2_9BACL|nr:MFS transporter [Polycladomyces subterraneus]MDN4595194.1 MFS transporter [Polycladomyces subterraneus]
MFINGKFLLLWLASIFAGLSISIYILVEQWYVVKTLDLKASLGVVMMATTIPRVLLMAVGGVLADRLKRSNIIFVSFLIRGLLTGCMAFFVFINQLDLWILLIFALLFGALDALFWPARDSILPLIVKREQLTRANSFMQTTKQLSVILGPVLGSILLSTISYKGVFTTIAILLVLGSLIIAKIKEQQSKKEKTFSFWQELKDGIVYVRRSTLLSTIMLIFIVVNFLFIGPLMMGIPLIVDEKIHGSALDLSYLQSSFAGGMLLGALAIGTLNPQKKRGMIAILVIGIEGFILGLLSQVNETW